MAYLAIDLGAGSGRGIVGEITNDGELRLLEIHRFKNNPVRLGDMLYWDFLYLFSNIKKSLQLTASQSIHLEGMGVDTWGVDFALIDEQGQLLANPVCYRDVHTLGLSELVKNRISEQDLYEYTGIQQMEINTLFRLFGMVLQNSSLLSQGGALLFTPDLINYFLSGQMYSEYTIASTSQLLNASGKDWEKGIFEKLNLPIHSMQKIIFPGQRIGLLHKDIADETGVGQVPVLAVGSHDTASAIGAIPDHGDDWAFLSSGTWSLFGLVCDKPVLTEEARKNNFTNEGGVDGKILLMRNITGLWLIQRLMAEWEEKENRTYSYEDLLYVSQKAPELGMVIDCDAPGFVNPKSMTQAICEFCAMTKQNIPHSKAEYIRCVLESLAIKYRFVMDKLQHIKPQTINRIYIVGGGSQNELLNQYTANALGIPVFAGLSEATAVGNIMQQAIGSNKVEDWHAARQVIKNNFSFKQFVPQNTEKFSLYINTVHRLFKE